MTGCEWEPIHGFNSPAEYRRFCTWLELQIQSKLVEEIPIDQAKSKMAFGFDEKWFKCLSTGDVWSRVAPEAPFRGLWDVVEK